MFWYEWRAEEERKRMEEGRRARWVFVAFELVVGGLFVYVAVMLLGAVISVFCPGK